MPVLNSIDFPLDFPSEDDGNREKGQKRQSGVSLRLFKKTSDFIMNGGHRKALATKVQICVVFMKIGEIDTLREQFSADVLIKAKWREPALDKGKIDEANIPNLDDYWNPKLFIENTLGEPRETVFHMVVHNTKGEAMVHEKRRAKGLFIENLELNDFPFDVQDLTITVASEKPLSEVELIEDTDDVHRVHKQSFADEQEWMLYKHIECETIEIAHEHADPNLRRSALAVKCRAARRSVYFLWNIFLVTFLICCLCLATFSVDRTLPQNRLQLSFTLVLTNIAFKFVVNQCLPKISYLTYLDKYIIASMLVLTTVCMWHAFISVLKNHPSADQIDMVAVITFASAYFIFTFAYGLRLYVYACKRRREMTIKEKAYLERMNLIANKHRFVFKSRSRKYESTLENGRDNEAKREEMKKDQLIQSCSIESPFSNLKKRTNVLIGGSGSSVPRQVQVCVVFMKIGEIDTIGEQFSADVLIKAKWREPDFDSGKTKVTEDLDLTSYWNPKLFIENTLTEPRESIFHMVVYNDRGEATVHEKRRVKGLFIENLELNEFPFDVQDLTITVASEKSLTEVELIEDPYDAHRVYKQSFADEQEWMLYKHIISENLEVAHEHSDPNLRRSALAVKCRAARRAKYFIWNIFLVTFVICCLSFATFAVDRRLPQSRLDLGFTLVLTNIAFKFVVTQCLPKISYLTYLDKYIIASILVLVTVCIWHAFVIVINDHPSAEYIDKGAAIILGIFYFAFTFTYGLKLYLFAYHRKRKMLSKEMAYLEKLKSLGVQENTKLKRKSRQYELGETNIFTNASNIWKNQLSRKKKCEIKKEEPQIQQDIGAACASRV
ncbi:unnamed protein product [Owenia fusiformis]|uniref:Uncharacterized protein n=1 Tax=Owenia fusiformis TaxID=6347 RepID=A0A8J1Y327_OWEFU|nr:unnamed protein product [Owenia fusiformis]